MVAVDAELCSSLFAGVALSNEPDSFLRVDLDGVCLAGACFGQAECVLP